MVSIFQSKSVKELQQYLKERGVTFAREIKVNLIELCVKAAELGIQVDPDGLLEDRDVVINEKVTTPTGIVLDKIKTSLDLSSFPVLSILDIYNYLVKFSDYTHETLRDFRKMEAYTMHLDGFVLELQAGTYTGSTYGLLKSKVKPRTNEKDPITKLSYYKTWIMFSGLTSSGTCVFSALCNCNL